MKTKQLFFVLIIMGLVAWTGCGGCGDSGAADDSSSETRTSDNRDRDGDNSSDDSDNNDEPESLGDALNKAGEALKDLGDSVSDGKGVEPVDFRKLKDMLPDEMAGLDRTNASGEKSGAFGIKVSQAEGVYEEGDSRITFTIVDTGTLKGIAAMGMTAWRMADIDRESDTSFERTTTYEDNPAYEKCDQRGDAMNCETQLIAAERYILKWEGRNVTWDQMKEAREDVGLRPFERMKDEGTE